MSTTRQLAAILFADIVGYTAMMQANEEQALEKLNRFKDVLEKGAVEFNGRIIQFYGDGCLILFNSAVDAVNHGKFLQEQFRAEPEVPVRIGIHLGDVVLKEENVYGDGVNIASRIQSLGHPNSVLFSAEIQDKIKNIPGVQTVSLGFFDFKNVSKPIEVFALSNTGLFVPHRKQMEGKLKKKKVLRRNLIVSILGLLILTSAFFIFNPFSQKPKFTGKERSIAVLPFTNLSSDKENEYFSDGMTDEITRQLSSIPDLKVIAHTSAMHYKDSKKSVKEIAAELDVASILEGKVQKTGNEIKITATLIDANTQSNIWSDTYEKELKDIFSIQNEVARHIGIVLQSKLFETLKKKVKDKEPENLEAYPLYLKGRYYLNQGKEADLKMALDYFGQAVQKDPGYAKAYAGQADAYLMLGEFEYIPGIQAWPKAQAAAKKALELDESLADAHNSLGHLSIHLFNWQVARQELQKALEISPTHAEAHHFLSQYYAAVGNMDSSIREILMAQKLDPLSLMVSSNVGQQFYRARLYDSAFIYLQATLKLQPGYPRALRNIARVYMVKGDHNLAIKEFENSLSHAKDNTTVLGFLGNAYGRIGEKEKALNILNQLKTISIQKDVAGEMALVYLGMGEKEQAFEYIEKAISELSVVLIQIKVDPEFDSIRDHPKYKLILQKMGLPL